MNKLYIFLKYFFIVVWTVFVVAPFLWALTTSFKDFQSVNGGVTYIPWVDFEPNLEGWKVLIKSPAKGGVDIIEPYFNTSHHRYGGGDLCLYSNDHGGNGQGAGKGMTAVSYVGWTAAWLHAHEIYLVKGSWPENNFFDRER